MSLRKIGFVQLAPVLGNQEVTRATIERLSPQFAGADLLVLPELCSSGYHFKSREQAWRLSEPVSSSGFLEFLRTISARNDQYIVAGFNEREGERLFNSAALVGPDGTLGVYRKLHLFLNEKDIFEPGDAGLPVFDIDGMRVGIVICFDWVFPEAWRVLALKGADVICHPSNLVLPGKAQSAVPVHATINGVYVVLANRFGTERGLTFTGGSLIAGPRGEVMAEAPADAECVRIVEIDLSEARDKAITERNDRIADRRPEFYGPICEV